MLVLALDTSSLSLSTALCEIELHPSGRWTQRTLAAEVHHPPARHGNLLPQALLGLCAQAGRGLADVQGLAVGIGPGSFTGLRVGLAAAKAIAYARRLPLAGTSSLRALARAAEVQPQAAARLLVPTLEARRDELYAEVLDLPGESDAGGAGRRVLKVEAAYRPPALVAMLREVAAGRAPLLFGPGQAACRASLAAAGAPALWFEPHGDLPALPLAAEVALLCARDLLAASYDEARVFALAPNYVKPSEAEVALAEGRVGGLPKK